MTGEGTGKTLRILAVLVLYECKLEESVTYSTLRAEAERCVGVTFCTLVVDNSRTPDENAASLPDVSYVHSAANQGLAGAYNRALEMACAEGYDWLLTLDQDTALPLDFLTGMGALACSLHGNQSVAAIVPQLKSGSRMLSPNRVRLLRDDALPPGFTGLNPGESYALNSAALIRVADVCELGGFEVGFWLDQLDLWLHHALYRAGKRVYVAGNIQVEHRLSLLDYSTMSPIRLRSFLEAESAFFDVYKGWIENVALTARLFVRYWKHKGADGSAAVANAIWERVKMRIFQPRDKRIALWKAAKEKRNVDRFKEDHCRGPQLSVCMATYNGESYIESQLQSILSQIAADDEVIIVDDGSRDRTLDIVGEMRDRRIRVIRHESNRGVLAAFETSISAARGQFICLSDQDDLWRPEKVEIVLREFQQHADADIVVSDAGLIDESGAVIGSSYFSGRGGFQSGVLSNLIHCSYLGCTMAFRRRIRARILPFPAGADVLHDLWIGTSNTLLGGRTRYIDQPLVNYRRHRGNATGNNRLGVRRKFRIRWDLCVWLARAWMRGAV
jgi:glycosyltransferase involved in cell wall biosynthesis